jgi:hypothetical protein
MSNVTHILSAIEQGDPSAAEQLLPLVYEQLRNLAAQKLAQEKPGQTLQATALVHEAYLRLVAPASGAASARREPPWNSRGHFFAAVAEAMRRILVDEARRISSRKGGGGMLPRQLDGLEIALPGTTGTTRISCWETLAVPVFLSWAQRQKWMAVPASTPIGQPLSGMAEVSSGMARPSWTMWTGRPVPSGSVTLS